VTVRPLLPAARVELPAARVDSPAVRVELPVARVEHRRSQASISDHRGLWRAML